MTTPTLKPCPNPGCGGEPVMLDHPTWCPLIGVSRTHYAQCVGCGMEGPHTEFEDEAATLWNSLPRTPEVEWLPEGEVPEKDGIYRARFDGCSVVPALLTLREHSTAGPRAHLLARPKWLDAHLLRWSRHPIPMPPPPGEES